MRLSKKELEQEVRTNLPSLDEQAIKIVVDLLQKRLLDALSQASMQVHRLAQRYGNSNIERMTDKTHEMIAGCEKKVTALWEEASGIDAYYGTPLGDQTKP